MNNKTLGLRLVSAVLVGFGLILSTNAATVGYWRFEGGTSGNAIVTATSEVNSPAMDGEQWSSNEADVLYSDDVVGAYIYDPVTSQYHSNTGSMLSPAGASTDDSQIVAHDMSALDGSFTLEMFVKVEDGGGAASFASSAYNRIFNLDGSAACNGYVSATSGGTTILRFKLGTELYDYTSHPAFQDGLWHHLAYVVDYDSGSNTTTYQLFRDSVKVLDSTYSGKFTNTSGNDVRFGVSGATLSNFDWFLDDVRLSDSALTTNQFLQVSDHGQTNATARTLVIGIVK